MKIIQLSINRKVTISMFTVAILLFGMVSLSRLKINLLPDLSYPTLTIRTEFQNAAPAEVENLVTKPIEEIVGVVKNVKQVRSISRAGQSDVTLEFTWGTNIEYAGQEVREKLDALQLPLDVKRPILLRFDPTLDPVMRYAISIKSEEEKNSATISFASDVKNEDVVNQLKALRRLADEQIKKELESADGVASVKVSGGFEDEIQVLVDERRLAVFNVTMAQLVQTLQQENINLSGGRLIEGTQQMMVRTLNQFTSIEEIKGLVVDNRSGKPIYVRDLADVEQAYKEREAITRLNGEEAVEIAIYKEGDANTVAVAEVVKKRLGRIQSNLPKNVELIKVYDQSTFINQAVDEVVNAGIVGGILAIIILYIFLRDFWSTIIISLSIPVSVIATFNLMYGYDISMNIMSLGGIALGIGLLVDNSIVVLESISKYKEKGMNARDAAMKGASEVGTAVIASTLTTVAVFFPLVFVEGIAGQLFKDQALTVTFSLLASLFVAITLIPMLASAKRDTEVPVVSPRREPKTRFGAIAQKVRVFIFITIPMSIFRGIVWLVRKIAAGILFVISPILNLFERAYQSIENAYPTLIYAVLNNRFAVVFVALLIFMASLTLVPKLGIELIPSLSQGEFNIEFQMPPGTPISTTDEAIRRIQAAAKGVDKVNNTFSVAGSGNRMDANPNEGGENWGEMSVVLTSGAKQPDEESVMSTLRSDLSSIPGLQYKFSRPALFSFSTPVEVQIMGYQLEDLKKVSDQLAQKMHQSDRFTDVKSTMEIGQPEIQIVFDRSKISSLGLTTSQIANDVVSKVRGDVATRYSYRDRKIDILVRAREEDRETIEEIRNFIINPKAEKPIPLSAVASINVSNGPGDIRRIGQQRVAIVSANLGFGDLGSAAQEITNMTKELIIPNGVYIKQGGQNDEMEASFQSLVFALTLAVFLVYLVMASQFESLIHPFVILFTIPLALIGAILALYLTNSTVSVVVFIGLILLAGIVVNNAIVLIDCINQFRREGMDKIEAIAQAGKTRLRPILITTLTTVLGLLPLSLGIGEGAEIRAPMGITVIGGLSVSTLLTLLVIPAMYMIMDRKDFSKEVAVKAEE
ncbi:efflux RND transporter permease subunit [bacterium]|nr:MAG: efflux RND transporter permease subunit [bacterium]